MRKNPHWLYKSTIDSFLASIAELIAKGQWGDCRAPELTERCGLHSNFRRCCVRFYVTRWTRSEWPAEERRSYVASYFTYWNRWTAKKRIDSWCTNRNRMGYVPCPTCIGRDLPPRQLLDCEYDASGTCQPVRP